MAIIVMNDGTVFDYDHDYGNVIRTEETKCRKVCFDLSRLKKKEKIYSEYKIPYAEKIVAFCKWSTIIPIAVEGVIFTDAAVYFYPCSESSTGAKIGKLSYPDLSSYIIIQEGPKGKVYALSENDEIRLYDATLIAENVAGKEIKQILDRVQRQFLQNNPMSKITLDRLASSIIQKVKNEMGVAPLSRRNEAILNSLMAFPEYANAAALTKAEYLFREFKPERYAAFAESLPMYVSIDVRIQIKSIPASFYKNYIRTLTDINREFLYKDLSTVHDRIVGEDKTSCIYRACLCIRMYEHERAESCISAIRRIFGDKDANMLEWFRCTYYYHEMMGIYEAIKKQDEIPATLWRCRDGIGLTPLHYAIILKDENAITSLLEKKEWTNATPHWKLEAVTRMFEYVVPACGKQLPQLNMLVQKTNKDAIQCQKAIKNIEARLKFQGIIREAQDISMFSQKWNYANRRGHHASKEELNKLSWQMENLTENIETAQDNADSLMDMLLDYEQRLEIITEETISEALEILEDAKISKDPLTKYLYRIYFEPGFLEKVLLAVKEKRGLNLYDHKGFYFIAPDFAEINVPVLNSMEQVWGSESETESPLPPDRPLYGNSWFSNEAHHSIDVLKSEYRKLAKTYHPDVCIMPNSNQIFQDISTEYSETYNSISNEQTTLWDY